jgi:hypothetical protein
VKVGTLVRFVNAGTASLIVHSNGDAYGVPHQNVGAPIAVNATYERTVNAADGSPFQWYCHAPGPDNGGGNPQILAVP